MKAVSASVFAALVLAPAGAGPAAAQDADPAQAEQREVLRQRGIDVAVAFLRNIEVVDAEGEEVGHVAHVAESLESSPGLYALISVGAEWFGEGFEIVMPLDRTTITAEGDLRLDGLTRDRLDRVERYVEDAWKITTDDYGTFDQAYEENDWW